MKTPCQAVKFAWLFSGPLINSSRANLIFFCRSMSKYIPGGPKTGAKVGVWAGARVKI